MLVAMAADPTAPLGLATVIKSRIQADVFDEFLGVAEAFDIANESREPKGDHFAHPAQPNQRGQFRVGEYFLCNEAAPLPALFMGMAQIQQQNLNHLPLSL